MLSFNQDGDMNGKSLMECGIYRSSHAKKLVVGSIQKDNKYFASSINIISNTILKCKSQSKVKCDFCLKSDSQIQKHVTLIIKEPIF